MQLLTKLSIPHGEKSIDYDSRILLLGSCFATSMSEKFDYFKFQHIVNPFGILFNVIAIENLIERSLSEKNYQIEELVVHNEQWHCLDTHSQLSKSDSSLLLESLNAALNNTSRFLKTASHIIITLGTAWVYQYQKNDAIVANCHKIPAHNFKKLLLSTKEVTSSLERVIKQIQAFNPSVHFIFTVSPVRHIKDGFTQNTWSKSILIQAVHQICESQDRVSYFPSYEIMMDELRDYRFYKSDMIHPNETAINYIWEKFSDSWIDDSAKYMMMRVDKVQKSMLHKPFNPNSSAYQTFLDQLIKEQNSIKQIYSHINF